MPTKHQPYALDEILGLCQELFEGDEALAAKHLAFAARTLAPDNAAMLELAELVNGVWDKFGFDAPHH